jgi:membrane fusion protein, multidrug efflux system
MIGRRAAIVVALVAVVVILVIIRSMRGAPDEAEIQTDVAVHVTEIRRATVRDMVTAYGRVEPEPSGASRPAGGALITPFIEGVVTEIDAVEGQDVAEGEVLVRLDSRMAEVALEGAQQEADFAEQTFQRQEALLAADGTSQRAYLEARQARDAARSALAAAETDVAYRNIATPLSGTVVKLDVVVGQHVDATTVLAQVVDLDRLVVTAGIPSREIGGVAVGQDVLLGSGASPPVGTVSVVGRDVDLASGTYRVQASIPAGGGFTPGQFTDIHIVADEHPDVLVVPEVSVVTSAAGESWISVVDGDQAVRRNVTVGIHDGGLVEVSGEGISEGLSIVTDEAYSLPEETAIHVVEG